MTSGADDAVTPGWAPTMCKPMRPLLNRNISAQYRIHHHDFGTHRIYDVTLLPTDCA